MSKQFRIAVVQQKSVGGDCAGNTAMGLARMEEAKALGADLILFPECYLTGYVLPIANADALSDDSAYLAQFRAKANELSLGVVMTAFTKGACKPRNTAFLFGRAGETLLRYDKVHTCDFADEACLESGEAFHVCDFDGVRLGVMICYDREYPESARVLMLKGAELILVPNDCASMAPRVQALSTRAYENMVGVVMANPPGEDAGRSCAFSPICWDSDGRCIDNTLLMADLHTEGLLMADFDLDALRTYRSAEMMGNTFRKVAAYEDLLCAEVQAPFLRTRGAEASS